jgi:hypothetical protein
LVLLIQRKENVVLETFYKRVDKFVKDEITTRTESARCPEQKLRYTAEKPTYRRGGKSFFQTNKPKA